MSPTVTDADRERARRFFRQGTGTLGRTSTGDGVRTDIDERIAVLGLASEFAAIAAEARRAALEEACRAVCGGCALGSALRFDIDGEAIHQCCGTQDMCFYGCAASAIRTLMEKE